MLIWSKKILLYRTSNKPIKLFNTPAILNSKYIETQKCFMVQLLCAFTRDIVGAVNAYCAEVKKERAKEWNVII